jgi:hypothetical protein
MIACTISIRLGNVSDLTIDRSVTFSPRPRRPARSRPTLGDTDQPNPVVFPSGAAWMLCEPISSMSASGWIGL